MKSLRINSAFLMVIAFCVIFWVSVYQLVV